MHDRWGDTGCFASPPDRLRGGAGEAWMPAPWHYFSFFLSGSFPHFYAIAWMYREDYARGGIRMLPVVHPNGESTARRIVACSLLLLIPVSLLPRLLGMTGPVYAGAAVAGGCALAWVGVRLGQERTFARARQMLLASVCCLSALLAVMVVDRVGF